MCEAEDTKLFIIILSLAAYNDSMLRFRSIDYIGLKIKAWAAVMDRKDVYYACTVVFVGVSSFILGRLSAFEDSRHPVVVRQFPVPQAITDPIRAIVPASQTASVANVLVTKKYVGSRSGTKYHLPECSGALRIAETNKVWFASREEAEKSGYSPASNCKGL